MKYLILLSLVVFGCSKKVPESRFSEPDSKLKPTISNPEAKYHSGDCILRVKRDLEEWDNASPNFEDLYKIIKVGRKKYLVTGTYDGEEFIQVPIHIELVDDDNFYNKTNCPEGLFK